MKIGKRYVWGEKNSSYVLSQGGENMKVSQI